MTSQNLTLKGDPTMGEHGEPPVVIVARLAGHEAVFGLLGVRHVRQAAELEGPVGDGDVALTRNRSSGRRLDDEQNRGDGSEQGDGATHEDLQMVPRTSRLTRTQPPPGVRVTH